MKFERGFMPRFFLPQAFYLAPAFPNTAQPFLKHESFNAATTFFQPARRTSRP